jgi:DNA-binding LytR/AlgR family response regulator
MKINTIIVDDNKEFLSKLEEHLKPIEYVNLIYSTMDSEDFLETTLELKPDLVIMDIDMPRISGIELGKILRKELPFVEIVYVTSHGEYIQSAFEVYASDFLQKPYNSSRLEQTLNRIKKKLNIKEKTFEVKSHKLIRHIRISEIICFEAFKRKVIVQTDTEEFEIDHSFNDFIDMLNHDMIYKTSRSYAVNLVKVKSIEPFSRTSYEIKFNDSKVTAFLSKTCYDDFRSKIKELAN